MSKAVVAVSAELAKAAVRIKAYDCTSITII